MSDKPDAERLFREGIVEEHRPWGKFRAFPHRMAGGIKIITVNPGAALSLQLHQRRGEYWVALDSGLEVTVGDRLLKPAPNEEITIPPHTAHRLRNEGSVPARLLEIWIGESEEGDIVRLEDLYGRT
ncbi:MAG: phosphomannose isomerase type II C-terminal cupin domain [Candidatus Aminicenantes bacterium]|nr:phosphomannose isomerase type II C-terminal cupin domain [Candidatus Aminicenantes bacterium]